MRTKEEIEKEFKQLAQNFEEMKTAALAKEGLVEMQAKHALYEIDPFFFENNNEYIDEEKSLVVFSEEDFNPETDNLFIHWVDMEQRKTRFRRWRLGATTYYDTVFEYHDNYLKSATMFFGPENTGPTKLAYLELKNDMPALYIETTQYGTISKKYHFEGERLTGYQLNPNPDNVFEVKFEYTADGSALNRIVQTHQSTGDERLVYQRPEKGLGIVEVLAGLEENLVEEITSQIQEKIRITEEKVYCILLEYCIQGPFPPAIGIGLESEYEEECLWGAADMKYFSETGTLDIDLHTPEIEKADRFVMQNYDIMKLSNEEFIAWEKEVKALYLRVCKRLFHMDFSRSFSKTGNFLVYAGDIDAYNHDEIMAEMHVFKKEQGL